MKRAKFTFIITGVLAVFVCMIMWILSLYPQENIGPMPPSELALTKAWNGEVVRVPGLLEVPQWMKETREYRKLLIKSRPAELTWKDLDGNTYIADAPGGRWKVDGGKYSVIISSIVKKRPNGSLENRTLFGNYKPFSCSIYDETGKKIMFISKGYSESYTVSFFEDNEDKMTKEWEINPELKIYSEQVRDEDGNYHFTHNMREMR
jgi:hypothetical protein